jgi:hypothetical protein
MNKDQDQNRNLALSKKTYYLAGIPGHFLYYFKGLFEIVILNSMILKIVFLKLLLFKIVIICYEKLRF